MAKKCDLCGKNASFLEGGSNFRGKILCRECYDKAASTKSDEELNEMGFNKVEISINQKIEGEGFITALRIIAWIEILVYFILSIMIWGDGRGASAGILNLLTGIVIFTVLNVLAIIAENVIAIRMSLESKDKGDK